MRVRTVAVASFALASSLAVIAACEDSSSPSSAPDSGTSPPIDSGRTMTEDSGRVTEDAAVADAGIDTGPPMLDFFADFESALPAAIDPSDAGAVTDTQGFATLGPAGKTFAAKFLRSATANVVKVTLTALPPHKTVSIGFLFAAIDSLDGTGTFPAGDFFRVTVDGNVIFRESFANATDSQVQSYVGPDAGVLARRVDLGFQGPGGFYTDSAYDMSLEPKFQNIPHTASTLTIDFTIEGEGNQSLDDESWAIDNLHVTTAN